MIMKLLLFLGLPILLIAGLIVFISVTLNVDDLRGCPASPQPGGQRCAAADAIVAISGGDTDARTLEAIRLYKAGWSDRLIFSGAAEDKTSISNAAAMRAQAVVAGVPEAAITLDEFASDTAGNAADLKAIATQGNFTRIILVTSPYHQRRASMEFERTLGPSVAIVSHSTPDDRYWSPAFWWLSPYSWYLSLSELSKIMYLQVTGK